MAQGTLGTDFAGTRWGLFKLAFVTSVLTVLTLGIYRFWMKTRLRRWYWSSIRPGGVPLEYTGNPVEILMGFLIAVTFLAFYIGIFNLILMFASYSFLANGFYAYGVSFVGLIPIYFYARYRARRFQLARTRWRGIRFGADAAAWRYSGASMWHWALTIISAGFLYPRQVFKLEKFRTDRTWIGDHKLEQQGSWFMLIRPALPLYLVGIVTIGLGVQAFLGDEDDAFTALGFAMFLAPVGALAWLYFSLRAFRLMAANKHLGPKLQFRAQPRFWRVFGIYIGGYLLLSLVLSAAILVIAFAFFLVVATIGQDGLAQMEDLLSGVGSIPAGIQLGLGIMAYFLIFILYGVLIQVFISMPVLRHYAETLEVLGIDAFDNVGQRARDEFADAEGFAEALDIGAAF